VEAIGEKDLEGLFFDSKGQRYEAEGNISESFFLHP
jgi:hypothetical protein